MLTVFFYARLWRRAGVMTDVEFVEIRYSGRPAAFLRGFRALYLGIPINCIVLGWVNLAMVKILMLVLKVDRITALLIVLGIIALTSLISTMAGLWGVLVTDVFQFVIKMAMVIVLAVAAVKRWAAWQRSRSSWSRSIGARRSEDSSGSVLSFVPDLELGVDADDHVPGLHLGELVGHLVSGRGAGRRRLRGPAHVLRPG